MSFNINKLKDLLYKKRISQRELSRRISITPSGLNSMFLVGDFKVSTLDKIAQALKVPVTYFFDDSEEVPHVNICGNNGNKDTTINIATNKDAEIEKLKIMIEGYKNSVKEKERYITLLEKTLDSK